MAAGGVGSYNLRTDSRKDLRLNIGMSAKLPAAMLSKSAGTATRQRGQRSHGDGARDAGNGCLPFHLGNP